MRDYIEIETTPCNEDCVQVKSGGEYLDAMRKEAVRYKNMLESKFPVLGGADAPTLGLKNCLYDFGSYIQLKLSFEVGGIQEQIAYWIENNLPETWDDNLVLKCDIEALKEEIEG